MSTPKRILVLRFSAMGDVAMVASVLKEFAGQNPEAALIMVSREAFKPFFNTVPNLTFHAIQPKTIHKGLSGLYTLFQELKKHKPDAVADLHDNLRSRILSVFFRWSGIPIKRMDKGRAEKKALTRSVNKILKPLKQTVERYADVFRSLNFQVKLSHRLEVRKQEIPSKAAYLFNNNKKKIGIAPFAQHTYKVYDLSKMKEVLQLLGKLDYDLLIFGGGAREKEIAAAWANSIPAVFNTIGCFNLTEELAIISNLDVMLSMDSSGMHMASLEGIPVVSIWGPTHPYAGFLGYGQSLNDCLQIDHPSQPNSIYGNKACICGVQNCIDLIAPGTIVDKVIEKLNG